MVQALRIILRILDAGTGTCRFLYLHAQASETRKEPYEDPEFQYADTNRDATMGDYADH